MYDNQYKSLLRSRIESAISQAKAAKGISHKGLKGEILEILIRDLFRPLLPADIGVGAGQIFEYYNKRLSNQQDVILYDKSILPPILFEESAGIFPVESVLYTIEIKTTLTASELRTSHEAAKKLYEFCYLPGLKNHEGIEQHHHIEKVRSVIFALNSDLTGSGKNEAERYREIYGEDGPYLSAICVAGKEYWFEKRGTWVKLLTQESYDEVLGFIGGVMNTYKHVAQSRGQPCLGHYIIDTYPEGEPEQIISGTEIMVKCGCDKCNTETLIGFGKKSPILNTKDGYNARQPCECGGIFRAPGGKYEVKDSELIRVGEYEEENES